MDLTDRIISPFPIDSATEHVSIKSVQFFVNIQFKISFEVIFNPLQLTFFAVFYLGALPDELKLNC